MDTTKEVNPGKGPSVETLSDELESLKSQYPEILQVAVVSGEGATIAARPQGSADDRLAAMSAFLLGSARKSGEGLGWTDVNYLLASHPDGYLIVAGAGKATLALTASPRAKLGLLLYDIVETARRVKQTLTTD